MGAAGYRLRSWLRGSRRAIAGGTALVALVAALVLTLLAGAARTASAPDRYSHARGDQWDVTIEQQSGASREREIGELPAVADVRMATFVFGQVQTEAGEPVETLVFAGSADGLGSVRLVEGRLPDATRPDEVVLTRSAMRSPALRVGDRLRLTTFTQEQADAAGFDAPDPAGPAGNVTVVGVLDGPRLEDTQGLALVAPVFLAQGDVGVSASVGVVALAPGATSEDLRAQLDQLADGNQLNISPAEWVPTEVRAAVNAQATGLWILAGVTALAAVVILGQLLSRQLRVPDSERRALLTLGIGPRQLALDRAARSLVIAGAGATAGALLAVIFSDRFPIGFVRPLEPSPGVRLDPLVHIGAAVLLAATVTAWALLALWLDRQPGRTRSSAADRAATAAPSAWVGLGARFAFGRAPGRSRGPGASVLGLGAVLAIAVGAITFGTNLDHLVRTPRAYGGPDIELGAGGTTVDPAVEQALLGSDDVDGLTLYGTAPGTADGIAVDVVGMQPVKGGYVPDVIRGQLPATTDEVALGKLVAGKLQADVGSTIQLSGATGPRRVRVAGIALVPPVGSADQVGHGVLVTSDGLAALDPSASMSVGGVRIAAGAGPGVYDRIAALTGSQVGVGPSRPPAIFNLDRVRTIPYLVALAVGFLALVSLTHLLIVSVRRRRRDLAVLRAIGATRRQLATVVRWQAMLTGAAIALVAVPVGAGAGRALYRQLVERVGTRPGVSVPVLWLVAVLVVLLVAAVAVAVLPGRRMQRDRPAIALGVE